MVSGPRNSSGAGNRKQHLKVQPPTTNVLAPSGFIGCEHPFDASGGGIALSFPGSNFGFDLCLRGDPPLQALAAQDSDLDFNHVEPAGVLGDIVELQPAQNPARFVCREGPVERAGRVRRQIVEHDYTTSLMGELLKPRAASFKTLSFQHWTARLLPNGLSRPRNRVSALFL